jgi:hypothetical protein
MSINEFKDYDEYISLIKNTDYVKLLVFSKDNCSACKQSLIESEKILKLFNNKRLIINKVVMHYDSQKNLTNSKIFDNYRIDFVPSYVLIYNNNFEKMKNPEIKYLIERIKCILDRFEK